MRGILRSQEGLALPESSIGMNYVAIKYEGSIKLLIMLHTQKSRKPGKPCSLLNASVKLKLIYWKINLDQTENIYHYKYIR